MTMLLHKKKGMRILSMILILLMVFCSMPATADAAYGDGQTDQFSVYVVDKGGADVLAGQWEYNASEYTLKTSPGGVEAPFITNGTLVYSGQDSYTVCARIGVVTKYISLTDLMSYAGSASGIPVSSDASISFKPGDSPTFLATNVYSEKYGQERHYYPSYIINQQFTTDGGIVPTVLAIKGWNTRNNDDPKKGITGDGGTVITDEATLADGINFLTGKADDGKAIRLFMGQLPGNGTETNLGGESTYYITDVRITPVYYDISVVTSGAVTVTTDDTYFKAAAGESVSFTLSDLEIGKKAVVSIKDAANNSYPAARSGNQYTFTMPATGASIHVDLIDSNEWSGTADTSWYNVTDNTFHISTQEQLAGLAELVNNGNSFAGKIIQLDNDIALNADNLYSSEDVYFESNKPDFSGTFSVPTISSSAILWTPVGTLTNTFNGTFDGDGHTISGLYTDVSKSYQGLFGAVGTGGCVENVTVSGVVAGNQYVGGIAGYSSGATIQNAINDAVIYASGGASAGGGGTSKAGQVGGIIGIGTGTSANPVIVTGCINNGTVTAPNCNKGGRAGGIVGIFDSSADYATVSECTNNGNINSYQYVGGIVGGQFASHVYIKSCYNTGSVTGASSGSAYVGGIVGVCCGPIENCYNVGNIYSTATSGGNPTRLGGIVGETRETIARVKSCYSIGTINYAATAIGTSGNIVGSQASDPINCYYLDANALIGAGDTGSTTAKTSAELKDSGMPAQLGVYFTADTGNKNSGYPVLHWQNGLTRPSVMYDYIVPTLDPIWTVNVTSAGISGSRIYDGSTVTVTVSRSSKAYASSLNSLVVTDSDGNTIPVTSGSAVSGGYGTVKGADFTFTMPESDVNIGLLADYADFNVYTQTGTGSAVLVKTYTRAQMVALATSSAVYYTGYDTLPSAVIGKAVQCVTLDDLLQDAGLSFTSGCSLYVNSVDSFPATYTYSDLFGQTRYYYPNLNAATDKATGKTEMRPILVIKGYQGRFTDFASGQNIDTMAYDTLNAYRFAFGQTETQFNNGIPDNNYKTVGNFAKYANSLTVISPETTNTVLINAISAANTNKAAVSVSTDGSDISTSAQWVTNAVMTAYTGAISTAQAVADNGSATKTDIENAVADLASATSVFNAAKAYGTKTTNGSGNGSSGSGSGGSGGGGSATPTQTPANTLAKGSDGVKRAVAETNTSATTDTSGKARASISSSTLGSALDQAAKSAQEADTKAGNKAGTTGIEVKVEVKAAANAKAVETALPGDTLKEMAQKTNAQLTVNTPVADISLDQKALAAIAAEAGSEVTLSAEKVDTSSLSEETRKEIGDAPVFDLKVMGKNGAVSSFNGGTATVSVPYQLKEGESASQVTVYYIDSTGKMTKMNCVYDAATKTATFETTHFSYYAVVIENGADRFGDISKSAWYYEAVNYAVKNGLFNGTGDTTFSPSAGMTRAMFVTVLGRAGEVNTANYAASSFSDVKSGSWYGSYVQWAYENKIVSGVGDGKFAPDQAITREEMASILTHYNKWKNKDAAASETALSYSDTGKIAGWAAEGVKLCAEKAWLTGYPDGSFQPQKTATRAEVANVLYKVVQ